MCAHFEFHSNVCDLQMLKAAWIFKWKSVLFGGIPDAFRSRSEYWFLPFWARWFIRLNAVRWLTIGGCQTIDRCVRSTGETFSSFTCFAYSDLNFAGGSFLFFLKNNLIMAGFLFKSNDKLRKIIFQICSLRGGPFFWPYLVNSPLEATNILPFKNYTYSL